MNEIDMVEYDYLRAEINQKIELHNKLIMFTITSAVAVLAFIFESPNQEHDLIVYLIPWFIILPMSNRVAYYRNAMAKISAYMIVFLEKEEKSMNWETRNQQLTKPLEKHNIFKRKTNLLLKDCECLIVGIACYFLYLYMFSKEATHNGYSWIGLIVSNFFLIVEIRVSLKSHAISR
ncbi:MAG: hypothetical protein IJS61_10340 [Firmicutes bacterium]|nr:hypothetical protein [Bacillota bacterium]